MNWKKITEEKPPVGKSIMIYSEKGGAAEGQMESDGSFTQYRWNAKKVKATHWAYRPEEPLKEPFNYFCANDHVLGMDYKRKRYFRKANCAEMSKEDMENVTLFDFCPFCGEPIDSKKTIELIETEE